MKIINRGERLWWIGRQVTCNICSTVSVLEADDTVQVNRRGIREDSITIHCPTCGVVIIEPMQREAQKETTP